jgi:hypothetical protein
MYQREILSLYACVMNVLDQNVDVPKNSPKVQHKN